jgi:hypothetical protein
MSIPDDGDGLAGQRMIGWLGARTPADWHFVASKLNWDCWQDVIDWILGQKSCDKATAAMMFRLSEPQLPAVCNREAAVAGLASQSFDFIKALVSDAAYRKRYSDELARLLYALATDIPHPVRMLGSRGTLMGRLKGMFNLD